MIGLEGFFLYIDILQILWIIYKERSISFITNRYLVYLTNKKVIDFVIKRDNLYV
jgi:hypothetical protein